ncbi:MAG TPA: MEDS domain-containing protein [Gaiellaceae bacterium]|nr:MEDS domain-containing protein [Gaiellaceae bacterium]
MRTGTAGRLPGEALCGHAVRIYHEDAELVACVASYLAAGLAAGEPAVAVVTREHRAGLAAALARLGHDPLALEAAGLLTTADAEATLACFLEGDGPSAGRFHTVIGALLAEAQRGRPGKPVRVFGEMVDLLARRGRHDAALAVEELWDGLVGRRGISLLCAYRLDLFDAETQRGVLPRVYRAHDHVEPALDPARLEHAVAHALDEALGREEAERVRRLAVDARRDAHVPAAQLALLWVSERMPVAAGRILAAARAAYERPAPAGAR